MRAGSCSADGADFPDGMGNGPGFEFFKLSWIVVRSSLSSSSHSALKSMSVLVGEKAPAFSDKAVQRETIIEEFSLDQFLGKQYVVFFFYPLALMKLDP